MKNDGVRGRVYSPTDVTSYGAKFVHVTRQLSAHPAGYKPETELNKTAI